MLASIIGQQKLKDRIGKLRADGELPHLLFCGPGEMGKKTIALALASDLCSNPPVLHASEIRKVLDLTGALTNIRQLGALALSSIDNLPGYAIEIVIRAISDYELAIPIGDRRHTMPLPEFTMIATTEQVWQINPKLRRWFVVEDLEPYSEPEISEVIQRVGTAHQLTISRDAADELAHYANGSPGSAEVLLKRIKVHSRTTTIYAEELGRILDRLGLNRPTGSLDLATRLSAMSGVEFENWVADFFRARGFAVEATRATGDHGIDLVLRKNSKAFAVQCKRWNDAIGEPVIRDFYGSVSNDNYAGGFVVTTSSFTEPANLFAEGKPITLLGMGDLIKTTLFEENS